MNSNKIEQAACDAVKDCFRNCDRIDAKITENDKTIAWDGLLYLFNNPKQNTESYYGKLSVQVKGHVVRKNRQDEISYPLYKDYIKAYKDEGIVYFVVDINEKDSYKTTVYYRYLAPIEIKELLVKCGKQKSISIKLKKFVYSNYAEIETDLMLFYDDCKRQKSFADTPIVNFEDLKGHNIQEFKVFSTMTKNDTLARALVKKDVFIYANIGDDKIKCLSPIGTGRCSVVVAEKVKKAVFVNNTKFFDDFSRINSKNSFTVAIGKCLKLVVDDDNIQSNNKNIKINITFNIENYCLSEAIKELEFILTLINVKHLSIAGVDLDLNKINKKNLDDFLKFKELQGLYNRLVRLKTALTNINVSDDLDLKLIKSKNDEMLIDVLIKAFTDNQDIFNKHQLGNISEIELGNINVLVAATKTGNNQYHIEDYFHSNLNVTGKYYDGTEGVVPLCAILNKEKFLKYSNIVYEDILPSFKKLYVNDKNYLYLANAIVLHLLLAYDEQRIKDERKINTAMELAKWLIDVDQDEQNKLIYILNKMQIKKRKQQLDDADNNYLSDLLDKHQSNEIKFAIYLLLDEQSLAMRTFNKMDKKQQTLFKTMPIFNFVKVV